MRLIFTQSSEEKIIAACKKGDHAAQKKIYEKYSARMLALCSRYITDYMEAEDTMVGGFVKVFEKISQFKSEGSFEGWIRRIMVNEALANLRRKKSFHLSVSLDNSFHGTAGQINTDLEVEDLLGFVQDLPDGYRTVFNLYAIEGFSHKEIAEKLDITESTSKSQLSRARAMLQQKICDSEKKINFNNEAQEIKYSEINQVWP